MTGSRSTGNLEEAAAAEQQLPFASGPPSVPTQSCNCQRQPRRTAAARRQRPYGPVADPVAVIGVGPAHDSQRKRKVCFGQSAMFEHLPLNNMVVIIAYRLYDIFVVIAYFL